MIDDNTPTPRPWVPDPSLRATARRPGIPPPPHTASAPDPGPHGEPPFRPSSVRPGPEASGQDRAGWQPVAGPADRVSFFEEQARHRRATWRLGVVSTLAVVLAGLPLSLVLTPLVFLVIVLLTKASSVFLPLSPAVPQFYRSVALAIGSILDAIDRWPPPPDLLASAIVGAIALVAPSILTMLVFWILLRRLFSGAGVGALAIGLGARDPRPADFEEHQLVNVVEEMALAAGLPAPRVMLLDGQIANAAVVGSSPADATAIVSRRLLDELDRDETQGVLAHLIASIGNGDLGVALMMVTVFRTFGLVNILLDAPVSSSARATLWRLLTVVARRGRPDDAVRVAQVAELLGSRSDTMEIEDVDLVLGNEAEKAPRGLTGLLLKIRVYAMFPIWAASGMARTAMGIMTFALLSPLLGWTWRERCYLADATAVQLTRNPDGIARGLQALLTRGGGIRGGEWANHLFVVGGGGGSGTENKTSGWISPHPSLQKRLRRLQAQGAHVDARVFKRGPTPTQVGWMVLIFGPLIALCVVLLSIAVVLATGLTILFMMIPLAIVYGIFELLF